MNYSESATHGPRTLRVPGVPVPPKGRWWVCLEWLCYDDDACLCKGLRQIEAEWADCDLL